MAKYRVKPGRYHGAFREYGPGDLVELDDASAEAFADKLELVSTDVGTDGTDEAGGAGKAIKAMIEALVEGAGEFNTGEKEHLFAVDAGDGLSVELNVEFVDELPELEPEPEPEAEAPAPVELPAPEPEAEVKPQKPAARKRR